MKRWVAALAAATVGALWVACSFPAVTYDAGDASVDAAPEASDDAAADASEEAPPPDFPDADPDVFNACDQDKDGYKAIGCDGGKDCNDFDKRAHPGQDFVTDVPNGPPDGDWNCANGVEPQYPTVSCGGFLNIAACKGEGFTANPGCGKSAAYVKCTWNGLKLSCEAVDSGTRTQGCR
jgi:hypothetical protein